VTKHECSIGGLLNGRATEDGQGLMCVHGFVLRTGDEIRDQRGNIATVGEFVRSDDHAHVWESTYADAVHRCWCGATESPADVVDEPTLTPAGRPAPTTDPKKVTGL